MTKMTKKEKFALIAEVLGKAAEAGVAGDVDTAELIAFAKNEIVLLEKKAAKAKETAAAKKAEADELYEAVEAVLTDEYQTIADVTAQIEGEDVTPAKVGYRLRKLVENGVAEKDEISVPATNGGKARKLAAYRLVVAD